MPNQESIELSERELEILKLVATGAGNKEIAQKLFISSNTVKVHLRNIFAKIGVNSRTEAAMYAVRTGLVVHAPQQIPVDQSDSELTGEIIGQEEPSPLPGEVARTPARKVPRWAPLVLMAGVLGLVFLGLRLSPSLAIFNSPTPSPLPPQPSSTPLPHWNHRAGLPSARSDPALVAYADQIYAIGGVDTQGVYGGVDRYDPQTDSWNALPSKPIPVFNAQAAVINGSIYVPGGRTNPNDEQPTDVLEIYDTNTGLWHTGAHLPLPLSAYGMVAYDGDLYVFGGWDGHKYLDSVYQYNPTSDTWQERTSMPTARGFCGVAEAGEKIYVIGGINDIQSVDVNEIYSPARDTANNNPWSTGFPIPEDRSGIEAANIADTIYVFGGEAENSNRVGLIYFPQTNVWQSLETSPYPLGQDFGMTSIGTNLFFIGGLLDYTFTDQNLTYQAIITLSIPIIIR
jgi:DNA-binding CsgD family transcriptional regulator/N-acetylneuraminic acid mutarotase